MFRSASRLVSAARGLSTSSALSAEAAKAPIQLFGIEGRYAHALFSAASQKQALDKVEKELKSVKEMALNDEKFSLFLKDPVISRTQKTSIIQEIMQAQKFSDLTVNFFAALAENNRLANTTEVVAAFEKIMSASRGELVCVVTSATDLKKNQTKEIEAALKNFASKGQTITVEFKTNPDLLGGFVVDIDDKFIDLSVRSKIQQYSNLLRESL